MFHSIQFIVSHNLSNTAFGSYCRPMPIFHAIEFEQKDHAKCHLFTHDFYLSFSCGNALLNSFIQTDTYISFDTEKARLIKLKVQQEITLVIKNLITKFLFACNLLTSLLITHGFCQLCHNIRLPILMFNQRI